jgi:chemotaxis protein methyltransferase CheR
LSDFSADTYQPAAISDPEVPALVGQDLPEDAFREIRDILFNAKGFDLDSYKDRCIKRRIAARIRQLGLPHVSGYVARLAEQPAEQAALLEALTIHVSQFFRNPTTFVVLEEQILPELLRARPPGRELRIWSAGCASGEEPYSLALLCDELCRSPEQVSIYATDISTEILKKARQALYEPHRVAEVPDVILQRYFTPEAGNYRLNEELRKRVHFFRNDILNDRPFHRVDLILCRNLLIYFSPPQQDYILRTFAAALVAGGYLVLGRSETMISETRDLFECVNAAERIYRKKTADGEMNDPSGHGFRRKTEQDP